MSFKIIFDKTLPHNFKSKNKKKIEGNFEDAVHLLKAIHSIPKGAEITTIKGWRRLGMGYRGIGFCEGIPPFHRTKEVIPGIKISDDHVAGTSLVGSILEELIKKENYNYKYLINNWLYDNLHLWATIRVTREQHSGKNILRNMNTLEDKLMLKHYKNIDLEDLIVI